MGVATRFVQAIDVENVGWNFKKMFKDVTDRNVRRVSTTAAAQLIAAG